MKRSIGTSFAAAGALVLAGALAGAVIAATPADSGQAAPPQFVAKLRLADTQLGSVERSFGQIKAAKTDAARDALAPGFETAQSSYSANMNEQYAEALRLADQFAKSKGKTGTLQGLKAFEDLAQAHEKRLTALDGQAKALAPKGAAWLAPTLAPGPQIRLAEREPDAMDRIADFFIPQARAAIALAVYNACNGHANTPACAKAIAKGVVDGNTARTTYNNCWNSKEGVRPKWWRAVLRAGCVTALTIRLA